MSDTTTDAGAPQPGWWQASDGNWYPPQNASTLPPPPPYAVGSDGPPPSNGAAITALVLGILSLLLFWAFGIGALLGIGAVVAGVSGKNKAAQHVSRPGQGIAVAGIVTGAIGIVGGVLIGGMIVLITFLGREAETEFRQVGEEIQSEFDGGINTDPSDGFCNEDRFMQDPDC